nr:MAG TPA: hypothetical protein [Caudoviricetes sp.]
MHQYAPDHHSKTSRHKPAIFLSVATTRILYRTMGHIIIISSSYHRIVTTSSHCCITGTHPGQHPRKEGGTIGGVIYIAK